MHLQRHDEWDPLDVDDPSEDAGLRIAAQKRMIRNILSSYTGYFDLFAETIQNALDAVERRIQEAEKHYAPRITVAIDLAAGAVTVTDNGTGMDALRFSKFMTPNRSFKDGKTTRGHKGVGATFLAYAFNYFKVCTKDAGNGNVYCGVLKDGRVWFEDSENTVARPKVQNGEPDDPEFDTIDRGTSITVRLVGPHIRPKDLNYIGATTASTWLEVLRIVSPIGGIYLSGAKPPEIGVTVKVTAPDGTHTSAQTDSLGYVYPHEVLGKCAELREFLEDAQRRLERGLSPGQIPPKFQKMNGIWGEWSWDEIAASETPVNLHLDGTELDLATRLGITVYAFLGYSTELWDEYNDKAIKLRKGYRILQGGLQLATRNMVQGLPLTIPLTNNIGFQNLAHIIIHLENAEPNLGRQGFQPEVEKLAKKISVSIVTALRKYYPRLLRKRTGAPALQRVMRLGQWIDEQKDHEREHPLVLSGAGLFMPTEYLPIRSLPQVEQDVVAMFNQMLSSGIVRGIEILSSSQFNQYDALYRHVFNEPISKYIRRDDNPLGIDEVHIANVDMPAVLPVSVLEYKYKLDHLIEEFQTEEKSPDDIGLVVVWDAGSKWRAAFDATSYLDPDQVHLRQFHGLTHSFSHSASGTHAFTAVILSDLVGFLESPALEVSRQRQVYSDESDLPPRL